MIKNIFLIAVRNIQKHKIYSAINILGLAVGFTAFILISLFLKYETSWDRQNENYKNIYRFQERAKLSDKLEVWTQSPPVLMGLLQDKYPEFEKLALLQETWGQFIASSKIRDFFDNDGCYADQAILDIFSYQFIEGDKKNALTDPFSIVLSKKVADKLFPKERALGKTVLVEKKYNLKVTGVYADQPKNSHLLTSYMISFSSYANMKHWDNYRESWGISFRTYALLKSGADYKKVNGKIINILNQAHTDPIKEFVYLHPLSKLYLEPTDKNDYMVAIISYGLLALFILLLSSINYINLTTANAALRAKEIAVRKVHGSSRGFLILQFLGETIILSLIAVTFALLIARMLLPMFGIVVDREIDLSYIDNGSFIAFMLLVSLVVGFLSGIYPAFSLSSHKIVDLLKGKVYRKLKGNIGPKKILVIFQYVISIALIIQSIMVYEHIQFIMNKDLGFQKDNLLFTKFNSPLENRDYNDFRNSLLKHPEIINASSSMNIPFYWSSGWPMSWEGNNSDEKVDVRYNEVSTDFINTMGIQVILGRDFSRDYPSDKEKACLINETAWKRFGWADPIGKTIDGKFQVIGVVKDFHPYSMHEKIPPYLVKLKSNSVNGEWLYAFRILPGKTEKARSIITQEIENYFPDMPFEIQVFTEYMKKDGTFKTWNSINHTFIFFTLLNILLAMIGIFGLVSFTTQRKTKEIGIRKVHGSSVISIYLKLVQEFFVLMLISIVFAWPLAYFFYHMMPGAYKSGLHMWEFLAATMLIFLITILTTSYQTLKVSFMNPIDALRYE
jgi:putative ABC transport system permease protein